MIVTESTTVSDVLRDAAQILETRGHCKGMFDDAEGRVCLWGAIRTSLFDTTIVNVDYIRPNRERDLLQRQIRLYLKQQIRELFLIKFEDRWVNFSLSPGAKWNDLPETRQEDVVKFLTRTADEVEFK